MRGRDKIYGFVILKVRIGGLFVGRWSLEVM